MEAQAGPTEGPPPPGGGSPPPEDGNSIPFEDRSLPFLERLARTAGLAFSDPAKLFSAIPRTEIGPPLLYGVLIGTVDVVFSVLWQMAFGSLAMLADSTNAEEFAISTGLYLVIIVASPLLVAIGMFISAGIYHLVLLLLGDGRRGFAVTFRAVSYGSTPQLLAVVPLCGAIAGGIWGIILVIIAASMGHGTEWWRALLAYFLPAILCCCLLAWALMSLGFLGALAG